MGWTMNHSQRRFQINSRFWEQLNVGDEILIQIQEGYLGYDFVTEINSVAAVPNDQLKYVKEESNKIL